MPYAIVAAAAATVGGSLLQASATQGAAHDQEEAANNATKVQLKMYDETVAREQPFVGAGTNALQALQYGMGLGSPTSYTGSAVPGGFGSLSAPFDASKLAETPGYQFTFQQGEQALQDQFSASGGVGGGNALRAATQFGEGLASTTYQQQFQDYLAQQAQQYGFLQTIAGSGQNAAANLGALGASAGQSIGSNIIGAGNAQAAGVVGATNALTGGINSLAANYLIANMVGAGSAAAPAAAAASSAAAPAAAADFAYSVGFG
jgi:hypothetical protein